jgi:hypothetical protein
MGLDERDRPSDGYQLVVLYFGATGCGPCHVGGLKAALGVLKDRLTRVATAAGGSLHLVGVALDDDIEAGIAFLRGTATFDEIVVGGGMKMNTAAARYLVQGPAGYLGIPQIVVHERVLRYERSRIEVLTDREIARYMGAGTIAAWVEEGATVPALRWRVEDPPASVPDPSSRSGAP